MTNLERIRAAAYRSFLRLKHIHSLTTSSPSSRQEYDISSRLAGTPPTQIQSFMDTGSDVIWIKCLQSSNVFNPAESSSCSYYSCDSLSCNDLGASGNTCGGRDFREPCYYIGEYVDGSTTRGTISHDKFAFEGSERELVDVGHLDFGCSYYSSWEFVGNQTNRKTKFSYCMVLPDNEESVSRIYFGSEKQSSHTAWCCQTPFDQEEKAYYYVTLNEISIGGFVFDSGTTYTMLRSEAYDVFVTALHKAIRLLQRRDPMEWFEKCFEGSFQDLDSAGPDVTFFFYGVQVMLTKQTTYIEVEQVLWCLAIIRSNEKLSTFGNIQQRNYFVGYDVEQGVVSFAPVDCATF
ncbi:hypothetical protein PRUPE_1G141200 [Prunus persica]|uniref:Peptidase A1 domain-containing protein n=1 Tax=Prunus persica TaxID=3760 RepID=A0A251QXI6_PRUPE|nr:hypothetical protein PRUPE_1G141200 [Prunus persica]